MTSLWTDHTIDAGCFLNPGVAMLSISTDSLSRDEVVHSQVVMYSVANGAVREMATCPWRVVSLTVMQQGGTKRCLALGEDGQLLEISQAGVRDLSLTSHVGAPKRRGPLRKVRSFAGQPIVVGMNRQVYAVESDGQWRDLSPPVEPAPLGGFEGAAGLSLDDFICVGWRGEMWRYRQGAWTKLDSPTNLLVTDITRTGEGNYFACGLNGLVLTGRDDHWHSLDQRPFDLNLYSVAEHSGSVYVASMYGLYEIREERLHDVSYGPIQPPATAHTVQSVDASTLGLVGAKDLYLRKDGAWMRCE
ncbi:hypothetical protein ACS5PN_27825 [Roseateles sp. NT4]|uniref:hypothetical protein n=1 Tax=Roseateles sp. NT4 TaxID=3453715 RepID=UPI003EEFDC6E